MVQLVLLFFVINCIRPTLTATSQRWIAHTHAHPCTYAHHLCTAIMNSWIKCNERQTTAAGNISVCHSSRFHAYRTRRRRLSIAIAGIFGDFAARCDATPFWPAIHKNALQPVLSIKSEPNDVAGAIILWMKCEFWMYFPLYGPASDWSIGRLADDWIVRFAGMEIHRKKPENLRWYLFRGQHIMIDRHLVWWLRREEKIEK